MFLSCSHQDNNIQTEKEDSLKKVDGVYRLLYGERDGFKIGER